VTSYAAVAQSVKRLTKVRRRVSGRFPFVIALMRSEFSFKI
jgi:hypothetical protein